MNISNTHPVLPVSAPPRRLPRAAAGRGARAVIVAVLALVAPLCGAASSQSEPLQVAATAPTWGALARTLGGDAVDVTVLCRSTQDMHVVQPTPSMMGRLQGAELLLYTGLDAEIWLEPMLRGSGNVGLLPGSPRAINMSDGVRLKQVPSVVSRAQGDVHAFGNPHIWSDPLIVRAVAPRVRDALIDALPGDADAITARWEAFHEALTEATVRWLTEYADLAGEPVVVYHQSWIYFLDRFGIRQVGTVEPKPRVVPTAAWLDRLVEDIRESDARVVIREPYHHPQATDFIEEKTGVGTIELSTHPGFPESTDDVIAHFEYNLATLAAAIRGSGS